MVFCGSSSTSLMPSQTLVVGQDGVVADDVVQLRLQGRAGQARGPVVVAAGIGGLARLTGLLRLLRGGPVGEGDGARAGHPGVGEVALERSRDVHLLADEVGVGGQPPLRAQGRRHLDVEDLRGVALPLRRRDRDGVVVGEAARHDPVGRGRLADDVAADGLGGPVLTAERIGDRERRGGLDRGGGRLGDGLRREDRDGDEGDGGGGAGESTEHAGHERTSRVGEGGRAHVRDPLRSAGER